MSTSRLRLLGAALVVTLLGVIACSQGRSVPGTAFPEQRAGYLHATMFVPPRAHQTSARISYLERAQRSHGRRPRYFSGATTEMDFILKSNNGVPATTALQSEYDFVMYTDNTSQCTGSSTTGYVCSVTEPAPAGADGYAVQAQQCSSAGSGPTKTCASVGGSLTLLSASLVVVNVTSGKTVTAAFTLSPVVGSLDWAPVTYATATGPSPLANGLWFTQPNGANAPAYNGALNTYSCGFGVGGGSSNGCYEPVRQGVSVAYGVTLEARDPSGALIVAASNGGPVYQTPVYLDRNGNAISISWSCHDAVTNGSSLTWETGGGPYNSNASASKANATFNSPVANPAADPDGGHTTDANGNPVTAVGNNGVEMSWDGIDAPLASNPDSCTATTSNGIAARFGWYAGLGATPPPPTPTPTTSPTPTPTPTPVPVTANPTAIAICPSSGAYACNPTSATVAISQPGFTGTFGETDTCASLASVTPIASGGPNASYKVSSSGSAVGQCTATFTGQSAQKATVTVDVTSAGIIINLQHTRKVHP